MQYDTNQALQMQINHLFWACFGLDLAALAERSQAFESKQEQNSQVVYQRLEGEVGEAARLDHSAKPCWSNIKVYLSRVTLTAELQAA